jgi:Ni/Co efflux regulator RcnB
MAAPQPIERHAPPAGGQPNVRGDRFQGDRGAGGGARFHGDREPGGQNFDPGHTARFGAPPPNSPPTGGGRTRQFAPGDNPYLRTAPPPERGGDRGRQFNPDRHGGEVRQQWQRGRYPPVYESQQRFRIGAYRAPRGYAYRHWRYGDILPFGWFATQYQMNDWWDYGLPDPPIDYYWVRVGPDALLIDRFDGRVVQVVRDIFW